MLCRFDNTGSLFNVRWRIWSAPQPPFFLSLQNVFFFAVFGKEIVSMNPPFFTVLPPSLPSFPFKERKERPRALFLQSSAPLLPAVRTRDRLRASGSFFYPDVCRPLFFLFSLCVCWGFDSPTTLIFSSSSLTATPPGVFFFYALCLPASILCFRKEPLVSPIALT